MSTHDLSKASPRQVQTRRPLFRRALYLGLYLAILLIGSSLFLGHRVAAELNERTLAAGRRLDSFRELSGRVTDMTFNGEELSLSTTILEQPIAEVMSQFVRLCSEGSRDLAGELSASVGRPLFASIFERALVPHDLLDDGTGSAACLAGLGDGGLQGLLQRAGRFARNLDVGELGQLRFAQLKRLAPNRTQLLLVTADGSLRLERMLALHGGDVPGEDAIPGARPPRSMRLLSARAKGTPHVVSAYRSELASVPALDEFGKLLQAKGFERAVKVRKSAEGETEGLPVLSETYRRGNETFVVSSQGDDSGSLLSVTALADRAIPAPFERAAQNGAALPGPARVRDPAFD